MRLTDRDYKIIKYIMDNNGATIEQLHKMFFPSYNVCSKRMKKLADNGAVKECLHPTLKRGWTGNLSYHTIKACDVPSGDPINDDVYPVTVKDVLLRSVQCYNIGNDSPVEWKYTFLKD